MLTTLFMFSAYIGVVVQRVKRERVRSVFGYAHVVDNHTLKGTARGVRGH